MSCFFNDCDRAVHPGRSKCAFHHRKGCCQVSECRNQVYARHRCVQHGGRKQCQVFGCVGNARSRGRCSRHGSDHRRPRSTNYVPTSSSCEVYGVATHGCDVESPLSVDAMQLSWFEAIDVLLAAVPLEPFMSFPLVEMDFDL
ncbi:Aste57867_8551 [Aphanomyces stellatus]|uniref:Aste57867_8551 protein n=1 Tax=Aphanomyces stellatus TaxID=120398 RepID=A0A485KKP8_9STRA|nr:hypothetical protein As57867_008519 [Aphanomyces stellatus]VFT85437.1 Aste57867_8551 [Aphanomyces stellatus]